MEPRQPCCQQLPSPPGSRSPFSRILALGFYDGPTAGILQCGTCGAVYRFDMLDWDDNQEVRVFRLAALPPGSLEEAIRVFEKAGPPRWPVWIPMRSAFPSEEAAQEADRAVGRLLDRAETARWVVAWSGYGERIVAARGVGPEELAGATDWFSVADPTSARDWFLFLGLPRKDGGDGVPQSPDEKAREEAVRRFQALADASQFRSTGPYPTRDELHERR
jgi:hypothetical protein